MTQIHNLDDSLQNYFEFIVSGHKYRFRYMTMEEAEEMQKIEKDEQKVKDYMFAFISRVDETSPEFAEVAKKMITPQWIRFRKMVETEFKG